MPAYADPARPRLLIMTDIGGDPDDQQSMIRLMNYADEFRIVGLVATSAGTPGDNLPDPTPRTDLIQQIVNAYGQVRPNLVNYSASYPTASELSGVIAAGNRLRGLPNIGTGKSTAGSNLIISAVDAASPDDPVNISIWGGATELAQALHDVRATRTPDQTAEFLGRMRVHAIADQDATSTQRGTGNWIQAEFPGLWYIESRDATGIGQSAPFRGMYQNQTRRQNNTGTAINVVPSSLFGLVEKPWADANVVNNHGPLGAIYPTNVWRGPTGSAFPGNSAFNAHGVKEGDTPSWFYFLNNGLNIPDEPGFGGWGGRFKPTATALFIPDTDAHPSRATDRSLGQVYTVARWREAFQRDFQARMDWNVAGAQGNRAPVSPLGAFEYTSVVAPPDRPVELSADGWTDPDGDPLNYSWWYYADPSSFNGDAAELNLLGTEALLTLLTPDVTDIVTLHLILEVTDTPEAGQVPLTRYQRFVVTVDPAAIPEPALGATGLAALAVVRRRRR
ncbi:MAG: nucleoside hydrolase-like domain-containing protein [Phycisphaerae bacterium]